MSPISLIWEQVDIYKLQANSLWWMRCLNSDRIPKGKHLWIRMFNTVWGNRNRRNWETTTQHYEVNQNGATVSRLDGVRIVWKTECAVCRIFGAPLLRGSDVLLPWTKYPQNAFLVTKCEARLISLTSIQLIINKGSHLQSCEGEYTYAWKGKRPEAIFN